MEFEVIVNNVRYNNVKAIEIKDNEVIITCRCLNDKGEQIIHPEQQYEMIDKTWIKVIKDGKVEMTFPYCDMINRII